MIRSSLVLALTVSSGPVVATSPEPPSVRPINCDVEWSPALIEPIETRGAPALARLMVDRTRANCFDSCGLSAAERLAQLGSRAVPALVDALAVPPEEDCGLTVRALGQVGEAAVESLVTAVLSPARPPEVRRASGVALMLITEQSRWKGLRAITPPASLQKTVDLLNDSDEQVREAGARALVAFGRTEDLLGRLRVQVGQPAVCCDAAYIRPLTDLCRQLPPLPLEHLQHAKVVVGEILGREKVTAAGRAAADEAASVFEAHCLRR